MVITKIFVAVTFKHLISYSSLFYHSLFLKMKSVPCPKHRDPQMSTDLFAANQNDLPKRGS